MTTATTTTARLLTVLGILVPTLAQVACSEPSAADSASAVGSDILEAGDAGDDDARRRRGGVYAGYQLYGPNPNAEEQADIWRSSRPDDAAVMDAVARNPIGLWLGEWIPDVTGEVDDALDDAAGKLPTFVVYNIPDRDCGNWSAGGLSDAAEYAEFIDDIADGMQGRLSIVVLEPDALAVVDCLDSVGESARLAMMSDAVDTLTAAGAAVYIDAGDSNWIPADDMAEQLEKAGVDRAAGFALNVSHTEYTQDEIAYAEELRAIVGLGAHYVIDTSRNGVGPTDDNEWCNPMDRAHGPAPTTRVGNGGLDAMLWVKRPGESDGYCNGGPEAGHWWDEYALDLAKNAGY